jgi:hypothetical protein
MVLKKQIPQQPKILEAKIRELMKIGSRPGILAIVN